jgi:acyl-coenzyme A thioesterase PaaI-like protein
MEVMLTADEIDYAVVEAIPLHRLLGMRVRHDGSHPPAVSLPHRPEQANHLGATAGAVLFAVAEAASAAMVFTTYPSLVDCAFAIPSEATIRFRRPAHGELVARASPGPGQEELASTLEANGSATLPVDVGVLDAERRVVAELRVLWQLRPARAGYAAALPRRPR